MEWLWPHASEGRKAKSRGSHGDEMVAVHESDGGIGGGGGGGGKGGKFRKQSAKSRRRSSHAGSGVSGGFDGGSQREYEMWKMRTTSEDIPAIDRIFTIDADNNDSDDQGDQGRGRRRRRRFSTGDRQQATFSDSGVDCRWRFESSGSESNPQTSVSRTAGQWQVSFEEDELTTNIDDMIQGLSLIHI